MSFQVTVTPIIQDVEVSASTQPFEVEVNALNGQQLELTTNGTSGEATFDPFSGVLNIPVYTFDPSGYVPTSRQLSINGVAFDLSSNRSWTIPTHDPVTLGTANGLSLVGQILSLGLASNGVTGALSGTDWATFNSKEPAISAGTTAQYFRGDKTFQTLDKIAVGLSNVDNTSDANKPISNATQTALNAKENTITAGTTAQYFRGDKTFQTLNPSAVGASTVGGNIFTSTNPSAITFLRANSNNTVDWLSATAFRTAIGAQATLTNPITGTGVSGQVAFWNGTSTQTGSTGLTFDSVTSRLRIGGNTTGAGILNLTGAISIKAVNNTFQDGFIQIRHNASDVLDAGMALESVKNGIVNVRLDLGGDAIQFYTASVGSTRVERWQITNVGILQSIGSQQIRTSTGDLTLATAAGNGNIILSPHGTGRVRLAGTIDNGTGPFLTRSATGVITERTANQVILELLPTISGYNAGVNQVLRNNSGTLTWVNI